MSIGFSPKLPLSADYNHYDMIVDIAENVKQNFKNLLLTSPGERVMIPSFGCGLRNFLFENEHKTTELEVIIDGVIRKQVNRYLNYIEIIKIEINNPITNEGHLVSNRLDISISYGVPSLGLTDYIVINT